MMFAVFTLFLLKVFVVESLYIPLADPKNDTAEEIQNAICMISTKEIEASANATITRELKGVCTSNELNFKLDNLLAKVIQEIDGIKFILELNDFKMPDLNFNNSSVRNKKHVDQSTENSTSAVIFSRENEILMYNDTVIETVEGRKFFYYWKILHIRQLLIKRDMYKSSPDFQVLGHNLRLKFYPNHLKNGYFGIEMRSDSHGFLKKHKIAVLNQLSPMSDLNSGILHGITLDKRVFRVLERELNTKGYIVNDSVLIRLEIFLYS